MLKIRIYLLALAALMTACSTPRPPVYQGVAFITPAIYVSTAFLNKTGDLYVVPEKGILIEDVRNSVGTSLPWLTDGAYLVVPAKAITNEVAVDLIIAGKKRRMALSPVLVPDPATPGNHRVTQSPHSGDLP